MRLIALLVAFDLSIKTIIYLFFLNAKFRLVNDNLGFVPLINREQLSAFNFELNLGVSISVLIMVNTIILVFLSFLYFRLHKLNYMNIHGHLILSLFIAASICSIIDKLVLGGSLDYLLIYRWICDLKDLYLFGVFVYMVIFLVKIKSSSQQDVEMIKAILGFSK